MPATAFIDIGTRLDTSSLSRLERDIDNFVRRNSRSVNMSLRADSFSAPLGRISSSVKDFDKSLDAANQRVIAFAASAGILYGIQRGFRELVSSIVEVDLALREINVLFGLSNKQLQVFGGQLFDIAKKTGQSFNVVSEAATELARQGLSVEETLKRTRDALALTRLSGLDAGRSVETITAALNGFNESVLDSTQLVSKLAAVDSAFAVSSRDLAEAIRRVGVTAQDSGVSLDELLGLVTAVQQRTARGGANIGEAFKTIFTRVNRPGVLDQLEALGVTVRDLNREALPTTQILQNLANNFGELAPSAKSAVAEIVGGVYRINILRAALGDVGSEFSNFKKATDIAAGASDEAIVRIEQLNKSISDLANSAANNFKKLGANLGGGLLEPSIRFLLGSFNNISDVISNVTGTEEESKSAGQKFATGFVKGFGESIKTIGLLGASAALFKVGQRFFEFAKGDVKSLLGLNRAAVEQEAAQKRIADIIQGTPALYDRVINKNITLLELQRNILKIIQAQGAAQSALAAPSGVLASQLLQRGNIVVDRRGDVAFNTTNPKPRRTLASGYIPQDSPEAISEKIGAVNGGYIPGKIQTTNIKGLGRVIYNDAEEVRDIGLSQPAIIPPRNSKAGREYRQNFKKKIGYDPYMNEGYVPNYQNPFNKNILSSFRREKDLLKYIKSLGIDTNKGSSRIFIPISSRAGVKVAINPAGIAQNEVEFPILNSDYFAKQQYSDILPRGFGFDENNFRFGFVERLKRATADDFRRVTGKPKRDFLKARKGDGLLSDTEYEIQDFIGNYGLIDNDFFGGRNVGVDATGKLKLLDVGYNDDVRYKFYNRNGVRNLGKFSNGYIPNYNDNAPRYRVYRSSFRNDPEFASKILSKINLTDTSILSKTTHGSERLYQRLRLSEQEREELEELIRSRQQIPIDQNTLAHVNLMKLGGGFGTVPSTLAVNTKLPSGSILPLVLAPTLYPPELNTVLKQKYDIGTSEGKGNLLTTVLSRQNPNDKGIGPGYGIIRPDIDPYTRIPINPLKDGTRIIGIEQARQMIGLSARPQKFGGLVPNFAEFWLKPDGTNIYADRDGNDGFGHVETAQKELKKEILEKTNFNVDSDYKRGDLFKAGRKLGRSGIKNVKQVFNLATAPLYTGLGSGRRFSDEAPKVLDYFIKEKGWVRMRANGLEVGSLDESTFSTIKKSLSNIPYPSIAGGLGRSKMGEPSLNLEIRNSNRYFEDIPYEILKNGRSIKDLIPYRKSFSSGLVPNFAFIKSVTSQGNERIQSKGNSTYFYPQSEGRLRIGMVSRGDGPAELGEFIEYLESGVKSGNIKHIDAGAIVHPRIMSGIAMLMQSSLKGSGVKITGNYSTETLERQLRGTKDVRRYNEAINYFRSVGGIEETKPDSEYFHLKYLNLIANKGLIPNFNLGERRFDSISQFLNKGVKKPLSTLSSNDFADSIQYLSETAKEGLNRDLKFGGFRGAFPFGRKREGSVAELLRKRKFQFDFNEGLVPNYAFNDIDNPLYVNDNFNEGYRSKGLKDLYFKSRDESKQFGMIVSRMIKTYGKEKGLEFVKQYRNSGSYKRYRGSYAYNGKYSGLLGDELNRPVFKTREIPDNFKDFAINSRIDRLLQSPDFRIPEPEITKQVILKKLLTPYKDGSFPSLDQLSYTASYIATTPDVQGSDVKSRIVSGAIERGLYNNKRIDVVSKFGYPDYYKALKTPQLEDVIKGKSLKDTLNQGYAEDNPLFRSNKEAIEFLQAVQNNELDGVNTVRGASRFFLRGTQFESFSDKIRSNRTLIDFLARNKDNPQFLKPRVAYGAAGQQKEYTYADLIEHVRPEYLTQGSKTSFTKVFENTQAVLAEETRQKVEERVKRSNRQFPTIPYLNKDTNKVKILKDERSLYEEGIRQGHCVGGYGDACFYPDQTTGLPKSLIVSTGKATAELNPTIKKTDLKSIVGQLDFQRKFRLSLLREVRRNLSDSDPGKTEIINEESEARRKDIDTYLKVRKSRALNLTGQISAYQIKGINNTPASEDEIELIRDFVRQNGLVPNFASFPLNQIGVGQYSRAFLNPYNNIVAKQFRDEPGESPLQTAFRLQGFQDTQRGLSILSKNLPPDAPFNVAAPIPRGQLDPEYRKEIKARLGTKVYFQKFIAGKNPTPEQAQRFESLANSYIPKRGIQGMKAVSDIRPQNVIGNTVIDFSPFFEAGGLVPNFLDTSLLKAFRATKNSIAKGGFDFKDLSKYDEAFKKQGFSASANAVYDSRDKSISLREGLVFNDPASLVPTITHEGVHKFIDLADANIGKRINSQSPLKAALTYNSLQFQKNTPSAQKVSLDSFIRTHFAGYPEHQLLEEALADGSLRKPGDARILNDSLRFTNRQIKTANRLYNRLSGAAYQGLKVKGFDGGLVPNFNAILGYPPLQSSLKREMAAGLTPSQIRVGSAPELKGGANPLGLAVYNTRDEPQGLRQGIRRYAAMGLDPKKAGTYADGHVPNFAPPFESTFGVGREFGSSNPTQISRAALQALNDAVNLFKAEIRGGIIGVKDFKNVFKSLNNTLSAFDGNVRLSDAATKKVSSILNSTLRSTQSRIKARGGFTGNLFEPPPPNVPSRTFIPGTQQVGSTQILYSQPNVQYSPSPIQGVSKEAEVNLRQLTLAERIALNQQRLIREGKISADKVRSESDIRRDLTSEVAGTRPTIASPAIEEERRETQRQLKEKQRDAERLKKIRVYLNERAGRRVRDEEAFRGFAQQTTGLQERASGLFFGGSARRELEAQLKDPKLSDSRRDLLETAKQNADFKRQSRFTNVAIGGSFLLPAIGGGISSSIGDESLTARRSQGLVGGAFGAASGGLLGAQFGGGYGAVIGATIGGLSSIIELFKNWNNTLPDVTRKFEKFIDTNTRELSEVQQLSEITQKIQGFRSGELKFSNSDRDKLIRDFLVSSKLAIPDEKERGEFTDLVFKKPIDSSSNKEINRFLEGGITTRLDNQQLGSLGINLGTLINPNAKLGEKELASISRDLLRIKDFSPESLNVLDLKRNLENIQSLAPSQEDAIKINQLQLRKSLRSQQQIISQKTGRQLDAPPDLTEEESLLLASFESAQYKADEFSKAAEDGIKIFFDNLIKLAPALSEGLTKENLAPRIKKIVNDPTQLSNFKKVIDNLTPANAADSLKAILDDADKQTISFKAIAEQTRSRINLFDPSRFTNRRFELNKGLVRGETDLNSLRFSGELFNQDNEGFINQTASLQKGLVGQRTNLQFNDLALSSIKEINSLQKTFADTLEKNNIDFLNGETQNIIKLLRGASDELEKTPTKTGVESSLLKIDQSLLILQESLLQPNINESQQENITKSIGALIEQRTSLEESLNRVLLEDSKAINDITEQTKQSLSNLKVGRARLLFGGVESIQNPSDFLTNFRGSIESGKNLRSFNSPNLTARAATGDLRNLIGAGADPKLIQKLRPNLIQEAISSTRGSIENLAQSTGADLGVFTDFNVLAKGLLAQDKSLGIELSTEEIQKFQTEFTNFTLIFGNVPIEKLTESIKRLSDEAARAEISLNNIKFNRGELFSDERRQANLQQRVNRIRFNGGSFDNLGGDINDSIKESFSYGNQDLYKDLLEGSIEFTDTFRSGIRGAFNEFITGAASAEDALRNLGVTLGTQLLNKSFETVTNQLFGQLFGSQQGGGQNLLNQGISAVGSLFRNGGAVRGYAGGGMVSGGSGVNDDIPSMLQNGSYVLRKSAVSKYGRSFLDSLGGRSGYASGGSARVLLTNQFDAPLQPTSFDQGRFNVSSDLSVLGQTDENNPQNINKFQREQGFFNYVKNKRDALAAFERAKKQRLQGAYLNAALAGVSFGIGQLNLGGSKPTGYASELANSKGQVVGYELPGRGAYTGSVGYSLPSSLPAYNGSFGLANGGYIKKYALGGYNRDVVPAFLMGGEYVVNKQTVDRYGPGFFNRLNAGQISNNVRQYALGGPVGNVFGVQSQSYGNAGTDMIGKQLEVLETIRDEMLKNQRGNTGTATSPTGDKGQSGDSINNNITISITVNRDGSVSGENKTETQSDKSRDNTDNYKQFANTVQSLVIKEIIKQKQDGGLLSKAR